VSARTNVVAWYDVATGETNIVYTGSTNRTTRYDSVSIADNATVTFMAANPDDTNRIADVYVLLPGGDPTSPMLVSSMPTPQNATVLASSPLISPDAKRVYFKVTTISKLDSSTQVNIYVRDLAAASPEFVALGSHFSKMIRTPAGPLVLGDPSAFGFTAPSTETDLALISYPASTSPSIPLQIGQSADGWRISFDKIPNVTPKVQSADILAPNAWSDVDLPLQDGGAQWFLTDPTTTAQRFYRLFVSP
jgi:hypothetical protein